MNTLLWQCLVMQVQSSQEVNVAQSCCPSNRMAPCCSFTHLKRKRRLLVVDPHKDLPDDQLLAVIAEQKLRPKAFIVLSLERDVEKTREEHFFAMPSLISNIYVVTDGTLHVVHTLLMFPSCSRSRNSSSSARVPLFQIKYGFSELLFSSFKT